MRILALLHDSFGGRGGIAKFNRDLLQALCSHKDVTQLVTLPRVIVDPVGDLPEKLDYRTRAAFGKAAFLAEELLLLAERQWFDLIICGHLRLVPLLCPLRLRKAAPMGLILHGVDAWEPYGNAALRAQLKRLDWFLAVSDYTRQRFLEWSGVAAERGLVIPNAVDLAAFTPGEKRADLVQRYGLEGRRVLMGMGRLDTRERYKGFDEVIELLPELPADIAYLICGEGSDRPRLEAKAQALGVATRVVFAGYVPEAEKTDTYRLADCFLLAGWGEGFGIVLIEAMACGIPAIASSLDASTEAVEHGRFGQVVNPKNASELRQAIERALASPKQIPAGLETFSASRFEQRIHHMILDPLLSARRAA